MAEFDNKTCARLEVHEGIDNVKLLFVKSEWKPARSEPTSFSLAISDGLWAWKFEGTEKFVQDRAEAWDKSVSWVMDKVKFYLSVGQPGVTYRFNKTRDNQRKLSFDIEDTESELPLTANFILVNASDPGSVTSGLLDFLHDSNCRLTESYLRKRRDFDRMTRENEVLTEQNERFKALKNQFKEDAYKKFVPVLNSKKAKLRELRKEIEKLTEQTKSKIKVESERDDTTSSSSDDDEEESDHQRPSPEKKIERDEAFNERLVGEVKAISEPVATSGVDVVNAGPDPDATQPLSDEIENEDPSLESPKEVTSSLSALVEDKPYVGLQRKKRRN